MILIEGMDFVVREVPFPTCGVDGAIVSQPDGLACIYINANVCDTRKREALRHELEHLKHDDLYSEESASSIEGRMNG